MYIEDVLARLSKVRRHGEGWMACCPAHEDRTPSLGISVGSGGNVLLKCFAGCPTEAVVAAMGLRMADLFVERRQEEARGAGGGGDSQRGKPFSLAGLKPGARWNLGRKPREFVEWYDYRDAAGGVVFRKLRFRNVDAPGKTFVQVVPVDGELWNWGRSSRGVEEVLYNLPGVLAAVAAGERIWFVEGEKDAQALIALGMCATCNADGAGKWRPELGEALRGAARVVVVADRDAGEAEAKRINPKARVWDQGQRHATQVWRTLQGLAGECRCMMLPEEVDGWRIKDVGDWLVARGGSEGARAELEALAEAAPEWDAARYEPREREGLPNMAAAKQARAEGGAGAPLPHPAGAKGVSYDAAVLRRWLIEAMTDKDTSGHVKKRNMCQAVCTWLRERGRFFYDINDTAHKSAMWFDAQEKRLHRVGQDYFRSWLARESAFNRDLRDFKMFLAAVEDESLVGDETRGIEPRRYWHREEDVIYVSCGEGRVVRVDASGARLVDNGTDGVVFEQGYVLEEWELVAEDAAVDPFEACRVFSQISTVDGRGGMLVRLWLMGMFGSVGWKPLLVLSGDVGSGKTRVATAMFELLGLMPRVTAIDALGNIKDFWVSVDKGGLFCLDNADHHVPWLADALSVISTGGTYEKKKLYTDTETVTQRARCWAVVTSANPSFASDAGLSDRLITVLLQRVQRDSSERELAREISQVRDAGLSWMCYRMRAALDDREEVPRAMNRRHPDWAAWVYRLGRAAGWAREAEAAIRENEAYKAMFALQNDVLGRYILHACRQGFVGSAQELIELMEEECEGFNPEQWTVAKVGRALARLKVALGEVFSFEKKNHSGRAVYEFGVPIEGEAAAEGAAGALPDLVDAGALLDAGGWDGL